MIILTESGILQRHVFFLIGLIYLNEHALYNTHVLRICSEVQWLSFTDPNLYREYLLPISNNCLADGLSIELTSSSEVVLASSQFHLKIGWGMMLRMDVNLVTVVFCVWEESRYWNSLIETLEWFGLSSCVRFDTSPAPLRNTLFQRGNTFGFFFFKFI